MIRARTPNGNRNFILRGVLLSTGKKGIAQGRALTPQGDIKFWDGALPPLNVAPSPAMASGAVSLQGPATVDTNAVAAMVSGGFTPLSFAWTFDTTDGSGWSIFGAAESSAFFRCSLVPPEGDRSAVARCTVTDARGATGAFTVNVRVRNYGGLQ